LRGAALSIGTVSRSRLLFEELELGRTTLVP
jgi:hypothetical protein